MRSRRIAARAPRWALLLALTLTLLAPAEAALAGTASAADHRARLERPFPADVIPAGSTAVVRADGDCLRVRSGPGTGFPSVTCLPEGATVTALEGRVTADGYAWQRVQARGITGWAAEMFLRVSTPAAPVVPACPGSTSAPAALAGPPAPAPAPPPPPSIAGSVPRAAGFGLVIWSGGPVAEIATVAAANGCALRSVWTTTTEGDFIGYHFGAPAFVNQPWLDRFPEDVPGGTAAIVVCSGPSNAASGPATATITASITPAPTAAAPVPVRSVAPPAISATAAIVIDSSSGAVLFEKNAHQPLPPASLTKIATAILAVEAGDLDRWIPIDVDSRTMGDSTVMGLRPGDCFRVRDLLYGLMLPSGNDAALAIGRGQAGTDAAFVDSMNALLGRLGLKESRFANAHGLNAPGHVASASDLALLARYGMSMPDFVAAVGARQWTAQGSRTIPLANTNAFLARYPGADGVKTGFTEEAGRTLVASVVHNGRRVFVAVLNAPNREADAQTLFDWVFTSYVWV